MRLAEIALWLALGAIAFVLFGAAILSSAIAFDVARHG